MNDYEVERIMKNGGRVGTVTYIPRDEGFDVFASVCNKDRHWCGRVTEELVFFEFKDVNFSAQGLGLGYGLRVAQQVAELITKIYWDGLQ